MQETIFYVAAGETLGSVRDFANAKSAAPPTSASSASTPWRWRGGEARLSAGSRGGQSRWKCLMSNTSIDSPTTRRVLTGCWCPGR